MKITALRLYNVKRFAGRGVAIENIADGVNVLCAANEFGKSTSFEALHALFFQSHGGASKPVKALQPYSGGGPLVEADIVSGGVRYRLTKQFLSGKRAQVRNLDENRLVGQADEAERFIAGLIRGGDAGPAGLLWVRQGITGLEERSKTEEEGERRVRESLLASVQGEVESITGGRRMAEIMTTCTDALSELVTDGSIGKAKAARARTGGAYAIALAAQARLAAEEQRLAGEVARLREALDARASAQKRLAELELAEDVAERRAAVVAASAALDGARLHAEKLKTAEAEVALARNRRDVAEGALKAFRNAMAEAAALRGTLLAAQARREEARLRRATASTAGEAATAAVEAAEQAEREMRGRVSRIEQAIKAQQAMAELDAMRAHLAAAETVRTQLEAAEAGLALIAIPAKAVDKLQALEIDIAGLRSAREASLPTLRVQYLPGAPPVTLDGDALPDGQERGFGAQAVLEIASVGTITLRSNRAADADARLGAQVETQRTLFAEHGVTSLAEARRRQADAQEAAGRRDLLRQELAHLAPDGLPRLREAVALRSAAGAGPVAIEGDPEAARTALAAAEAEVVAARNRLREAQPQRGRADDLLREADTAVATAEAEGARLDAQLGPEAERDARVEALAATASSQAGLFAEAEARAALLRSAAPDLVSAEAALRRVTSVEERALKEAAGLREQLAGLSGQIRSSADEAVEEAWNETREQLAAANAEAKAFETEVAVLEKLRVTLQASRSAARDLYLDPVLAELKPLLGLLFDDVSITFDEKSLLPQAIRRAGLDESIDRLSGGMREQLSVLTRLAFARLIARGGEAAPIILDDALVYSDDDRIERMFNALHRQSRDQQIIVFSCRQRAFARLGGNVLSLKDWRPDPA